MKAPSDVVYEGQFLHWMRKRLWSFKIIIFFYPFVMKRRVSMCYQFSIAHEKNAGSFLWLIAELFRISCQSLLATNSISAKVT